MILYRINLKVVLSSRPLNMDNSQEVFGTYKTEMLDENRITEISTDVLKRNMITEIHRLPKSMETNTGDTLFILICF